MPPPITKPQEYIVNFITKTLKFDQKYATSVCMKINNDPYHTNKEKAIFEYLQINLQNKIEKWKLQEIQRLILLVPFRDWFNANKLGFSVMREITVFELQKIQQYPLYLYHAFNVSIPLCMDFAKKHGIDVNPKCIAFSFAWELIQQHPKSAVPKDEMTQYLREKKGLELDVSFPPFGPNPLYKHELQHVSLMDQSLGEIRLEFKWELTKKIREKKTCELSIHLNSQNMYVVDNHSAAFAMMIVDMVLSGGGGSKKRKPTSSTKSDKVETKKLKTS